MKKIKRFLIKYTEGILLTIIIIAIIIFVLTTCIQYIFFHEASSKLNDAMSIGGVALGTLGVYFSIKSIFTTYKLKNNMILSSELEELNAKKILINNLDSELNRMKTIVRNNDISTTLTTLTDPTKKIFVDAKKKILDTIIDLKIEGRYKDEYKNIINAPIISQQNINELFQTNEATLQKYTDIINTQLEMIKEAFEEWSKEYKDEIDNVYAGLESKWKKNHS